MHSVNVFCLPVCPLSNVTQAGLFFSFLAKFVYFVHILRVHLKVSLPKIRSQVCLPLQFESEFISVKYKACTKIHALHFSVQLWPLPVERTGRPSSSSHLTHACVLLYVICVCLWHVWHSACVEVKGQLASVGPLFHLLGAGDWTQIVPPWRQVPLPTEPSQGPKCTCSLVISVCLGLLMFTTANCSVEHRKWSWEYLRVRGSVHAIIFETGILLLECVYLYIHI